MNFPVRFGKYELLERLAMGGMAEVFLARSFGVEGFEKHLVIKRILPGLARSPRFVNMFIKEAKITAGLAHPNIVQTYELGRVGDDHYIAMEYIHGHDLTRVNRALKAEQFRMPMGLAVYTVATVLRGLGFAHAVTDAEGRALNLVHRDVSPHNVMLSFQGEVKIFDFGIARLLGESMGSEQQVVPGGGKFAYMSPEQATGRPMGPKSDIYSAGILLYELLVGQRLFKHEDPSEKLRRVKEADIPDPRETHPEIPEPLWAILKRMLSFDPGERPARAELAEEELWGFLFSHGLRADAQEMRAFLLDLYPEASTHQPSGVDLAGLADDLVRMDRVEGATIPDAASGEGSLTTLGGSGSDIEHHISEFGGLGDEAKTVVVLAVDILGFTDPSRNREPDAVLRWQQRLRRKLEGTVSRYGGKEIRFDGDQFLAIFGVPRAQEHDLERAVACAETLQRLAQRIEIEGNRVGLCIGVHRGGLAVSTDPERFRFLSRGDTVKLAWRLSLSAGEGEVRVSAAVEGLLRNLFDFQPEDPIPGRGQREAQGSYRLIGPRTERTRGAGRWLARGDELSVLAAAMAQLSRGNRAILKITGEAGTGKTWLIHEVSLLAKARGVPFYIGRAPPYAHERPLSSFRELIAQVLGVEIGDSAATIQQSLERLSQLGLSSSQRAIIGALFGFETPETQAEGAQAAMFQASIQLVKGLCKDQPVILAMENSEHLSRVERRLLQTLINQTRDCQLMLLFTARRSLPPELGTADYSVNLLALSTDGQADLVRNILSVETIDPALMERVAATAEGNPMYLEAVLRALVDSGQAVIEGSHLKMVANENIPRLPPGLDGLIAARIDALGATEKGVLQVASLVGMGFGPGILVEAIGVEGMDALLESLVEAGLVRAQPDGQYRFASTLVWEVVRSSILGQRKRDYHLMVATGMERHYAGHLDVHRQDLARHWAAAGRLVKAAIEGNRASLQLMRQQLLEPAALGWERSLGWLKEAKGEAYAQDGGLELEARLCQRAGRTRRMLGDARKAEVHLQIALDLAVDMGERETEAESQLELGRLYRSQSRNTLAIIHLEAAQQAAEAVGGDERFSTAPDWARRVAVSALEDLGILAREAGRSNDSAALFERALEIAGDDESLAAQALLGMASSKNRVEDFEGALELLSASLEKARQGEDRILMARILNNTGITHHMADRMEQALHFYREARDLYRTVGFPYGLVISLHNVGDSHLRLGAHGRAWAAFEESRKLAEQLGMPMGTILNEPYMAHLEALRAIESGEEVDSAPFIERIEAMVDEARRLGDLETSVVARALVGRTWRAFGAELEARESLERAVEGARKLESAPLVHEFERELAALG